MGLVPVPTLEELRARQDVVENLIDAEQWGEAHTQREQLLECVAEWQGVGDGGGSLACGDRGWSGGMEGRQQARTCGAAVELSGPLGHLHPSRREGGNAASPGRLA